MRAARVLGLVAVIAGGTTACGALVGLEDHVLAPDDAGALPPGADGSPRADGALGDDAAPGADGGGPVGCDACPAGYGCVAGRCGNVVASVTASATHACAVLANGELWCWGKSQLGQLGVDPSTTPGRCGNVACRPEPAKVPGILPAVAASTTDDLTCVLDGAGTVSCFGSDAQGALAQDPNKSTSCSSQSGDAGSKVACSFAPTPIALPAAAQQVIAGDSAVCARTRDQKIYCWGQDFLGQAGTFPIPPNGAVFKPTPIQGADVTGNAFALSASFGHGCAIGVLFGINCWGSNVSGELGHAGGDDTCVFGVPCNHKSKAVINTSGAVVAAGEKATCVRNGDGTVSCWGGNDGAQLGNGESVDNASHPVAQPVVGVTNVVSLEMRYETAFAIDGASHVFAWGYASDGALGVATSTVACTPQGNGTSSLCAPLAIRVPALDGAIQIASMRAGGVALKSDGSVWAWGLNDLGQLAHAPGTGDTTCADGPCSTAPQRVTGLP